MTLMPIGLDYLYFVEAVLWCCLQTLVTKQTGPAGKPVNTLYIAHKMKLKNEMYFAMLLDRGTMGPMIIACSEGTLFWHTLPVLTLCSEGGKGPLFWHTLPMLTACNEGGEGPLFWHTLPMLTACNKGGEGTLFWHTLPMLTLCSEGVSCAGRLACLVHSMHIALAKPQKRDFICRQRPFHL